MSRCLFCLRPLPNVRAPSVLRVRLDNGPYGHVELCWHLGKDDCAGADPLHLRLADAMDARGGHRGPDDEESTRAVFDCYLALRDRAALRGNATHLREAINILRDTTEAGLTLRSAHTWGRNARRVVAKRAR